MRIGSGVQSASEVFGKSDPRDSGIADHFCRQLADRLGERL